MKAIVESYGLKCNLQNLEFKISFYFNFIGTFIKLNFSIIAEKQLYIIANSLFLKI